MSKSLKRVAIWPSPWNFHLNNQIFDHGFGPGGAYAKAFSLWRANSLAAGYQIDTFDLVPDGEADVLWFIDLPRVFRNFKKAVSQHPKATTVLMISESPLICSQMFNKSNRNKFDHIVTYEQDGSSENTHNYRLPVPLSRSQNEIPFAHRRLLCMVNSNRVSGLWSMRQPGLEGLPGIGPLFNGWSFDYRDWERGAKRDLYIERRRIAREADRLPDLAIDFYGNGWDGSQISWCPLYRNKPYSSHRGNYVEDRIGTLSKYKFTLAYENWTGASDYITDRIFDGLLAGAVPVYLGDDRIARSIPYDAFIDAKSFSSRPQLLRHLASIDESEWLQLRESGMRFLDGAVAAEFSDEAFAERMTSILKRIT